MRLTAARARATVSRVNVRILYFAAVRELVGQSEEALTLPDGVATVARLAAHLEALHPALRGRLAQVRFAVDEELVDAAHPLRDGAEVALIPPVAGGSGALAVSERVGLLTEPLSVDAVLRLVRHPAAGALAIFVGVVRDHHAGEAVSELEYSAYDSMAVREMARVIERIEGEMPGVRLAVHHRVGRLSVGDDAIVCAASSAHRDQAFTAGRLLIDRIKETVPIWKRERGPGGEHWVGWSETATEEPPSE